MAAAQGSCPEVQKVAASPALQVNNISIALSDYKLFPMKIGKMGKIHRGTNLSITITLHHFLLF
jgi:hypothetical protein